MKAWKDISITVLGACLVGIAIYLAVTWFGRKEPVTYLGDMVIRGNTISNAANRQVHPAQFWDEGKVYVTVHYWRSNDTWAAHFRLTNNWDEVIMWLESRNERSTGFFILPSNAPIALGPMRP